MPDLIDIMDSVSKQLMAGTVTPSHPNVKLAELAALTFIAQKLDELVKK